MKLPVYLDNNATTPLDPEVFEEMLPVLKKQHGNPASNTHSYGWYAAELVQIARERIAELINSEPEEIIFTSGATESINLAVKGLALDDPKKTIITAKTEHKATLDSTEFLEQQGHKVLYLELDQVGRILNSKRILEHKNAIISLMLANNEIGLIHNISELSKLTSESSSLFHCDATQAVGKIKVDVKELNLDLMSLSAHKLYGPKGVGAIYIKNRNPKLSLTSLVHGGGHEKGYRSGTLNVAGIVGFGKACEIAKRNLSEESKRLKQLSEKLFNTLAEKLTGVELNGPEDNRLPGNLNLSFAEVDNARLIGAINSKLAISVSSACTAMSKKPSHVLSAIGLEKKKQFSSIRISIGRFNTEDEIDYAAEILIKAVEKLRI